MSQYWLIHAFEFLSFRDLHTCFEVSKLWREAATFPLLPIYSSALVSTWDLTNLSHTFLSRITHLTFTTDEIPWARDKTYALSDVLIMAFPHLSHLKSLNLSGTRVTDQVTNFIELNLEMLPSLSSIDLTNCKLLRDFRPIQTIVQMRNSIRIYLEDNHFQSRYNKAPLPTHVTFVNNTPSPVYTSWLDYSGKLVDDARIASGAYCTQNSYDSHPWVVQNNRGKTILRLVATKRPQVIYIGDCYPVSLVPVPHVLATVAKEKEVSIILHNKTETPLVLASLGFTGDEERTEQMPPNSRITIQTYETVPWIIWDEEGNLEHVTIVATKIPISHIAIKVLGVALTCTRYGHVFSANA